LARKTNGEPIEKLKRGLRVQERPLLCSMTIPPGWIGEGCVGFWSRRYVLFFDEFVNVLTFKLLNELSNLVHVPSHGVSLVVADLVNQGVKAADKTIVVSKSLRDAQSQLAENGASFS
jgi:hypothetical protein